MEIVQTPPPAPEAHAWLPWAIGGAVLIIGAAIAATMLLFSGNEQAPAIASQSETSTPAGTSELGLIGSLEAPIRLTYAIHWNEDLQTKGIYENGQLKSKGLKQYLEEYVRIYPDVAFQVIIIPYGEYADKLALLADIGASPDIYQIYAPWGVSYVKKGILDEPPADITEDISKNYSSIKGATIDGKIWGFPTEINTYGLLYNKKLFATADIKEAPKTWEELVRDASKLTEHDAQGRITQYGIAFLTDNDWQVVDPFLSLLFTNGGKYLSEDLSHSLFNSPQGVQALNAQLVLFKNKSTDASGNIFDFSKGKVAMVISPPWTRTSFAQDLGSQFESTVGAAPLPYLKKPSTLQYSWFTGVMAGSAHKQAAWDFLKWFNTEVQPDTQTTRYGDLLANTIGAIPSRKIDLENHPILEDPFTSMFIKQLDTSVSEPEVIEAGHLKAILMQNIQAAWAGSKTAQQALDDSAREIDGILKNNR